MPAAGDIITVPTSPGARIATTEQTSDSSTFTTTETVVLTVTAALVTGRVYAVWANPHMGSSVDDDLVVMRIREDDVNGTIRDWSYTEIANGGTASRNHNPLVYYEYTAIATGNKTFVVTGDRVSGTGNIQLVGSAEKTSYLTVTYVRDA